MFPSLGVIRNARKGVFEVSQHTAVLKELPEDLKPLADVLYRQRAHTDRVEQEIKRKVEWVFHRHGQAIKCDYGAWRSACKRAGVADRKVHDFRRTAVDRLE